MARRASIHYYRGAARSATNVYQGKEQRVKNYFIKASRQVPLISKLPQTETVIQHLQNVSIRLQPQNRNGVVV